MKPVLPRTIDRYFAAQNAQDFDALAACFTPDARVHDEARDHVGHAAVRAWAKEVAEAFGAIAEPLDIGEEGGATIVAARVTGSFPGSPITLAFAFTLSADGRISALKITQ